MQDELTQEIIAALKIKLKTPEKALIAGGGTKNVDAHDLFLKGRELLFVNTRQTFDQTITCFRRAIELDPNYGAPVAGLAMAYIFDYQNHFTNTPEKSLDEADRLVRQSLAKDDTDPFAHWVATVVATWKRDYDRWAYEADRALSLNPNYALAVNSLGTVRLYAGKPVEAIPYFERAIRLDPAQQQYRHFLGTAYFVAGNYETAVAVFKDRIANTPNTDLSPRLPCVNIGSFGSFRRGPQDLARAQRDQSSILLFKSSRSIAV